MLLQSFSTSLPVLSMVRVYAAQLPVLLACAALLHTVVLPWPMSTMLMVPLGLMVSWQGPVAVVLVVQVT